MVSSMMVTGDCACLSDACTAVDQITRSSKVPRLSVGRIASNSASHVCKVKPYSLRYMQCILLFDYHSLQNR